MAVKAVSLTRRMRGGAQAHLLACDDGNHYVTKFVDNPQHRRILVNEWTGGVLLDKLQISTPKVEIVEVTAEFLAANPEVCVQHHKGRTNFRPGWQFGSCFPGNPNTEAVYDYLPDQLLRVVANVAQFRGALVFDRWTGNSDSRQAIFFRRRLRDWLVADDDATPRKGFVAQMVDHGYLFDGPNWAFMDSPLQGLYFRPAVYEEARTLADFEPWLERIRGFPESLFDEILRRIPGEWLAGDEAEFERILEALHRRRGQVERLLEHTIAARPQLFPNWRR